jgi:YebC/PmpR family DNA-binding regulatory protein
MHKKGKTDAQRAKVFTKIGREIMVCVKEGGPDPVSNSKLRDLIAKAKQNNVPNDNIERVIKKASGADNKSNYESMVYEGYGPSGVAVIVEALTDNKNRTAADVRHAFDKFGGNLGTSGCVSFMFSRMGIVVVENTDQDEDQLMEDCMEAGADEYEIGDEEIEITCDAAEVGNVREYFEGKGYTIISAEAEQVPSTMTTLTDPEDVRKMNLLLETLEDNDDIQNVYHNWEQKEEIAE